MGHFEQNIMTEMDIEEVHLSFGEIIQFLEESLQRKCSNEAARLTLLQYVEEVEVLCRRMKSTGPAAEASTTEIFQIEEEQINHPEIESGDDELARDGNANTFTSTHLRAFNRVQRGNSLTGGPAPNSMLPMAPREGRAASCKNLGSGYFRRHIRTFDNSDPETSAELGKLLERPRFFSQVDKKQQKIRTSSVFIDAIEHNDAENVVEDGGVAINYPSPPRTPPVNPAVQASPPISRRYRETLTHSTKEVI